MTRSEFDFLAWGALLTVRFWIEKSWRAGGDTMPFRVPPDVRAAAETLWLEWHRAGRRGIPTPFRDCGLHLLFHRS